MTEVDPKVLIGLVSQIVFWMALFAVLGVFRKILIFGISVAFAEILAKSASEDLQRKIARWFANEDDILAVLKDIRDSQKQERSSGKARSDKRRPDPDEQTGAGPS